MCTNKVNLFRAHTRERERDEEKKRKRAKMELERQPPRRLREVEQEASAAEQFRERLRAATPDQRLVQRRVWWLQKRPHAAARLERAVLCLQAAWRGRQVRKRTSRQLAARARVRRQRGELLGAVLAFEAAAQRERERRDGVESMREVLRRIAALPDAATPIALLLRARAEQLSNENQACLRTLAQLRGALGLEDVAHSAAGGPTRLSGTIASSATAPPSSTGSSALGGSALALAMRRQFLWCRAQVLLCAGELLAACTDLSALLRLPPLVEVSLSASELDRSIVKLAQPITAARCQKLRGAALLLVPGRALDGMNDLTLALRLEPTDPLLREARGAGYVMQREWELAHSDLSAIVRQQAHPRALALRGRVSACMRRWPYAVSDLQRAGEFGAEALREATIESEDFPMLDKPA